MRREKKITLDDRGTKLTFRIQEMPATQLMDWIAKAVLMLTQAGADVPAGTGLDEAVKYIAGRGFAAIAALDYQKARPLMYELLGCCWRQVGAAEERVTEETADACISDVSTLFRLQLETFNLHFDFFQRAGRSSSPGGSNTEPRRTESGA